MKKQTRGAPFISVLTTITILVSVPGMAGCSYAKSQTPVSSSGIYFDTVTNITLYEYQGNSADIFDGCDALCSYYEGIFSSTIEGSDIWNINHSTAYPVEVSEDTADLLSTAIHYCDISEGTLDITLGEVSALWDFSSQAGKATPTLPNEDDLNEALSHVDYTGICITEENNSYYVTCSDPESDLELGFIAKGYIADRLKDYLISRNVTSAMINLGGNVYVLGCKSGGSDFNIGIQKPFDDMGKTITTAHIHDMSVVTSGTYERYFYLDNTLYHHILNPSTGYPYSNGIYSVSIESSSSTVADALSTLAFTLGTDKGLELIESLPDTECFYVLNDYTTIQSGGWR